MMSKTLSILKARRTMETKKGKSKQKYYLGKLNLNWADEIDMVYFDVFTETSKKRLEDKLRDLGSSEITLCFGTNEDGDYSGNDLLDSIEWIEILDETTRKFIKKNVCDYDNSLDHILESLWDDEEYDDIDEDEDEDEEINEEDL